MIEYVTAVTGPWPWGSGPAPALHCDGCRRYMGKQTGHYITETSYLLCSKCLWSRGETSRRLHAKFYPDCTVEHGVWDGHHMSAATRAGAWFVLTKAGKR
jgi:hypothetical protein